MLKNYRSYLWYKELRRQIEGKLAKRRTVLIHAALFLAVTGGLWLFTYPPFYDPYSTSIPGLITTAWSFVLLVHTLWSYFQSGLWPGKREAVIEDKMGELLESQPDFDDADFFQIHRLLDEDIRQRAGYHFSTSMFAIANAFLWGIWILSGTNWHGYALWYPVGFAAFVFLVCGGILNFWRSGQREQQRIQSNPEAEKPAYPRQKNPTFDEIAYLASTEHGRLEIVEDDPSVFDKRKRS